LAFLQKVMRKILSNDVRSPLHTYLHTLAPASLSYLNFFIFLFIIT
jgi:hypothetical protein